MDEVAIKVANLSKVYKLYKSPKDRLKESISIFKKKYHNDFYALNDVCFEVKKGETFGILGQNGSGKSTLLKIIAGVLTQTSGQIFTTGKIYPLLELGTGFNPEFTGIENIYFNGMIMGFSKGEIEKRIDDIISFADIGDFIYQPVKLYSSGMFSRLAFAVAVNVDPDILLIDEILSVGDAKFTVKSFNKMKSFQEMGKTILLVSHSIENIRNFTNKAILLDRGQLIYYGNPKDATLKYFQLLFPEKHQTEIQLDAKESNSTENSVNITSNLSTIENGYCFEFVPDENAKTFGLGNACLEWVKIYGLKKPNIFYGGEEISVKLNFRWNKIEVEKIRVENELINNIAIGISLANKKGEYIFGCNNIDTGTMIDIQKYEECFADFKLRLPYLMSGDYFMTFAIALGTQEHHVQLRWYDYLIQLNCISCKKYVYGVLHLDYSLDIFPKE